MKPSYFPGSPLSVRVPCSHLVVIPCLGKKCWQYMAVLKHRVWNAGLREKMAQLFSFHDFTLRWEICPTQDGKSREQAVKQARPGSGLGFGAGLADGFSFKQDKHTAKGKWGVGITRILTCCFQKYRIEGVAGWGIAVCLDTEEDPNVPLSCSCSVTILISKQGVNEENCWLWSDLLSEF